MRREPPPGAPRRPDIAWTWDDWDSAGDDWDGAGDAGDAADAAIRQEHPQEHPTTANVFSPARRAPPRPPQRAIPRSERDDWSRRPTPNALPSAAPQDIPQGIQMIASPSPRRRATFHVATTPPDDTLSAIASDALGKARDEAEAWWRSRGGNTVKALLAVTVIFVVVALACAAISALQPTVAAPSSSHVATSVVASATAQPHHVAVGIVTVSYVAGHAQAFTATVEVSATLWWGTFPPKPYICGTFTLAFSGYNRPREITCRLTLPPAATSGIPAHGYQGCAIFSDANATAVCWDNPKAFHLA